MGLLLRAGAISNRITLANWQERPCHCVLPWDEDRRCSGSQVGTGEREEGLDHESHELHESETETESIASLLEIQTLRPEKWPRSSAENRCPVTERQGDGGDMMKHLDRMQKNCLH